MADEIKIGTLWIIASNIAFSVFNYVIHFFLARHLGAASYGVFGLVMSFYMINEGILKSGVPNAAAKYISSKKRAHGILKKCLQIQIMWAVVMTIFYLVLSGPISRLIGESGRIGIVLLLGIMVIPLSLLFLYFNGYLNGKRMFISESKQKSLFAGIRMAFVLILVYLGLDVFGAVLGYLLPVLVFLVWISIHNRRPISRMLRSKAYDAKPLRSFAWRIGLYSVGILFLRNISVLLVKIFLADNTLVGLYTAAKTLSNVPYLIFSGLPVAMLPAFSNTYSQGNHDRTIKYVRDPIRYTLMFTMPMVALVAVSSKDLIGFLFGEIYGPAGPTFAVLTASSTLMVLFLLFSSIIYGYGKPSSPGKIVGFASIILVILSFVFIPSIGILGSAIASLIASFFAATLTAIIVFRKFRTLISRISFVRIFFGSITCSAFVYLINIFFGIHGILLIASYIAGLILYFLILYATKEIVEDDMSRLGQIIRNFSREM